MSNLIKKSWTDSNNDALTNKISSHFYIFLQTNCVRYLGGTGGGTETGSGICQLNQNIINQYIFLILWFWFVALAIIGFLQLVFETLTLLPKFRVFLIKSKLSPLADENPQMEEMPLRDVEANTTEENTITEYLNGLEIGDWFLLYQISKNMNKHFFYEFIKTVSKNPGNEEMPLTDVEANNPE
jgi:hypothetical protein